MNSIGLLILRVGIGGFMALHGWGKFQMMLAGDFDKFGDPIGLGSGPSLVLVTMAEFFGAIFLVIGFLTRLSALMIVGAMVVAAFVAHGTDPWTMAEGARLFMSQESMSWASKEPALLFLIPCLALVFTGPGLFSVDGLIYPIWREWRTKHQPDAS